MTDKKHAPRYDVTFHIEVGDEHGIVKDGRGGTTSTFGLIQFTRDCPSQMHNTNKREARHQEESNYKVIGITTSPRVPVETPHGMAYMEPALARNRHMHEGTLALERVTFSVPVECLKWFDVLLDRQGYAAVPGELAALPTAADVDHIVVTKQEADAFAVEALEEERAAMAAESEES